MIPADTTPNAFTFTDPANVALVTLVTFAPVNVTGELFVVSYGDGAIFRIVSGS